MVNRSWSVASAKRWSPWVRGAALVMPVMTCAILSTVREDIAPTTGVLLLVIWVVAAAATGDRVAGLLAAVSSGVWFDFFLTEPYLRFTIDDAEDIEATVLLVVIGVLVSEIALWGYRQQARASRQAGYLDGMLGTAKVVSEGDAPAAVVLGTISRQITDILGADRCQFIQGDVHDRRIALLDHDGVVTQAGLPVDVDRFGLPHNEYIAIPMKQGSRTLGHFRVTATAKVAYPSRQQLRVAVLLADLAATAASRE